MTMRRTLIILLLFLFSTGAFVFAVDLAPKDESFGRFFSDFQRAVSSGDKEKVASMINFASFTWDENEHLQQVKTKEAFLKNYDEMFTAKIKKYIATWKPTKVDENSYFINWYTKDSEYSLDFTRKQGESFTFVGLTIGTR
jgi:hypothetical protein